MTTRRRGQAGLEAMQARTRARTEAFVEQVHEYREMRLSEYEIARRLGVQVNSVARRLRRAGEVELCLPFERIGTNENYLRRKARTTS